MWKSDIKVISEQIAEFRTFESSKADQGGNVRPKIDCKFLMLKIKIDNN